MEKPMQLFCLMKWYAFVLQKNFNEESARPWNKTVFL